MLIFFLKNYSKQIFSLLQPPTDIFNSIYCSRVLVLQFLKQTKVDFLIINSCYKYLFTHYQFPCFSPFLYSILFLQAPFSFCLSIFFNNYFVRVCVYLWLCSEHGMWSMKNFILFLIQILSSQFSLLIAVCLCCGFGARRMD